MSHARPEESPCAPLAASESGTFLRALLWLNAFGLAVNLLGFVLLWRFA